VLRWITLSGSHRSKLRPVVLKSSVYFRCEGRYAMASLRRNAIDMVARSQFVLGLMSASICSGSMVTFCGHVSDQNIGGSPPRGYFCGGHGEKRQRVDTIAL